MNRFFESLRYQAFWLMDKLQGGSIAAHLADIKKVNEDAEGNEPAKAARLKQLLVHAAATVPFYNGYQDVIDNYPVVDKNIIKQRLDDFVSEAYNSGQLIAAITSGSTGTPFKVYHNKDKKKRNTADTIYFAKRGGFTIGSKLFYCKIWSAYNRKTGIKKWFENIEAIDVINLQAQSAAVVQQFKNEQPHLHILGYVSALETICKYLDKHAPATRLQAASVITMSEGLNDYTRDAMYTYFGRRPLSRYSNIENGIIAQQVPELGDEFLVNEASYLVEIFDVAENKKLPLGSMGRIVVTDYYNYGMPMIRYDSGDIGMLEERSIAGKKLLVLSKVEGRKLDQVFNTKGELISSYLVYKNMWKYTEIDQYQFVQTGVGKYIFKVCMQDNFERAGELKNDFLFILGADADFAIEYVNEIPLLDSGKRKKVANTMNQI